MAARRGTSCVPPPRAPPTPRACRVLLAGISTQPLVERRVGAHPRENVLLPRGLVHGPKADAGRDALLQEGRRSLKGPCSGVRAVTPVRRTGQLSGAWDPAATLVRWPRIVYATFRAVYPAPRLLPGKDNGSAHIRAPRPQERPRRPPLCADRPHAPAKKAFPAANARPLVAYLTL
jgi:hypothetical protein